MKRRILLMVSALTVGAAALTPPTGAAAAADTTPPVWTKVPAASIPVGAVLAPWDCDGSGTEQQLSPVYVDYQAADPQSGIATYYVATNQGAGPEDVGLVTRVAMTSRTTDPADCFGGGRPIFSGQAVNGAGLETSERYWSSSRLSVVQDAPTADLTYSGAWAVSTAAGFSDGTTRKTTQLNAAARFSVDLPATTSRPNTSALGLVMAKGPDRGQAQVWLDGKKVATINTYSATKANRTVVWRANLAPGSHTIRVVNLATAGHPRIDIDAFVLMPKGSYTF